MIYLDHAAATPQDADVLAAMQPYFSEQFYNPSATYLPAVQARHALDTARSEVAKWLGARPSEILFTAGGTESDNLAIAGVMRQFPAAKLLISAVEHDAVLQSASEFNTSYAPVTSDGMVDIAALDALIDDQTVLVSIMYANNEVGTVQPIRKIAAKLQNIRTERQARGIALPLYFHTDACQAANYLDLHVAQLGVDMMTLNGGKIYGPKQSGILYVSSSVRLAPLIRGGGQERGLRSGTENVAACIGFAKALQKVQSNRHEEVVRLHGIQQVAFECIANILPVAIINGSTKYRLPNNLHVTLPGTDNERILLELEQAGILASAGSACSASSDEPSHVLRAMGISDQFAQSSLRFTMGQSTSSDDIQTLANTLTKLLKKYNY